MIYVVEMIIMIYLVLSFLIFMRKKDTNLIQGTTRIEEDTRTREGRSSGLHDTGN